jgi:secondary thiamine-phosphate synthase enzyme
MIKELQISTQSRTEMVNIDRQVQEVIRESGVKEGICVLWVPHTTAGITINENADPAVVRDIIYEVNKLIPFQDQYHHMEGNSAAHIKSTLFSPSLTIIITNGRPVMGTWQSIYFCEFDGPRHRHLIVKALEG